MMNFSDGPHHKIWSVAGKSKAGTPKFGASKQCAQEGYTLVALLALMTVLALFAAAAAPSIRQQAQREREAEAIFRGEQIAEAIRVYYSYQERRLGKRGLPGLPTSIEQLVEGITSGTKKVQILRPSAARDPLSDSGEWRLIRPASTEMTDFTRAIMIYSENIRPATRDPQLQTQEQYMAPPVLPTIGAGLTGSASKGDDDYTGPFIGVASRNKTDSIIRYYGIDRHGEWIFTPLFK
jgi:type II secretory pathway pseudopilin PulG